MPWIHIAAAALLCGATLALIAYLRWLDTLLEPEPPKVVETRMPTAWAARVLAASQEGARPEEATSYRRAA